VDGGLHWVSQNLALPASIEEFSLPRRDRAYVVGGHGMIYHYRTVSAEYTAKAIVDAPLLPAYGGPLRGQLDQMRNQVGALQAKLSSVGAVSGGAGGSAANNASATANASSAAGPPGSSPASFSNAASGPAPSVNAFSSANTFSQDAAGASATTNSFSQDTSAQSTNFSQDSSVPPSATVQSCCAAQVADLQNSVGLMGQQVPSFSGEFRNLNMLFVGLNMFADLAAKAQAINQSFMTLKQAPNSQAALAALQNLSAQISGTTQAIDSGFQNLSAGNASGSSFGNSLGNMVGGAATGTAPPNQNGGAPNNGAQTPSPIQNPVGDAAQKAKDALNKLIHF
jgi:hypothetical protein